METWPSRHWILATTIFESFDRARESHGVNISFC